MSGNTFIALDNWPVWLDFMTGFVIIPFVFGVSNAPLLTISVAAYIAVAVGANVLFWSTDLKIFDRGRRYYLYRPNEYVDM